MPSGYTQDIYDGKPITFEQFALRCSRGMGAAIMQRDEAIDVEIRMREVSDHEVERVKTARAELEAALERTDEEWATAQSAEISAAVEYRDQYIRDTDALAMRYRDMLKQVEAWEPPTEDHMGLKRFMFDQLGDSIKFDVGGPGVERYTPAVPEELPVYMYKARQIADLAKRQADATQRLAEEYDRVKSQNEWVSKLRSSLAEHGGKTQ